LLPRFQRASPSTSLDKKFNYVIHCILYLFSKKVNIFLKYSDNNALYSIQKKGPFMLRAPSFHLSISIVPYFRNKFFYTLSFIFILLRTIELVQPAHIRTY